MITYKITEYELIELEELAVIVKGLAPNTSEFLTNICYRIRQGGCNE